LIDLIDRDDVGMIQRRSGLGFLDEAAHAIFVCSNVGGQNLESDFAIELCIFRQIHFAHPARAEFGEDAVVRDGGLRS